MISRRCTLALMTATALIPTIALAGSSKLTPLPSAMPKAEGVVVPSALSPELMQVPAAQGFMPLENPTSLLKYYGFGGDGPILPAANSVQGKDNTVEDVDTVIGALPKIVEKVRALSAVLHR